MVANRVSTSGSAIFQSLKSCVNLDKDGKNVRAFDDSLRNGLDCHRQANFLSSVFSMQVDPTAAKNAIFQRDVNDLIENNRAMARRTNMKASSKPFPPASPAPIKKEGKGMLGDSKSPSISSSTSDSVSSGMPTLEKSEREVELESKLAEMEKKFGGQTDNDDVVFVKMLAPPKPGDVDAEFLERNALENAKLMQNLAEEEAKADLYNKRGAKNRVCFLNPYSGVTEDNKNRNPHARFPHVMGGVMKWFELESASTMATRMEIWMALKHLTRAIPSHVTSSVEVGDIFNYHRCIMKRYVDMSREKMVEEIADELKKMQKDSDESFASFVSRFMDIMLRMNDINMVKDDDEIMLTFKKALRQDPDAARVLEDVLRINYQHSISKVDELIEHLEPAMDRCEERKKEDESQSSDTTMMTTDKTERNRERRRKKKEKKAIARALLAAGNDVSMSVSGVCLFYQTDSCKRNPCSFKHIKLSPSNLLKLKKTIEEKKEKRGGIVCHACGEPGHISPKCPKAQAGGRARVHVAVDAPALPAPAPASSAQHAHTSAPDLAHLLKLLGTNQEQYTLLARALIAEAGKSKVKSN